MSDLTPYQNHVNLRLPTRTQPLGRKQRRLLEQQEALEIAVERVRRNVQLARVRFDGDVAIEAIAVTQIVTNVAEAAAAACPPERSRVDLIADAQAASALAKVREMGL